jgi:type II secretory pathway pseudopilin PulG
LSGIRQADVKCQSERTWNGCKSLIPQHFDFILTSARALQLERQGLKFVSIRKAQGFALIDLIFVCGVIGLLCSIAVPRLVMAKQSAGAASAIGSMRAISSAQLSYALTCGSGFYAPTLMTLGTPPPGTREPFVGGGLGASDTVAKSGYVMQMTATPFGAAPASCNGVGAGLSGQGFIAAADPANLVLPRFFGTNANNLIYEHDSTLFSVMPDVGEPTVGHLIR